MNDTTSSNQEIRSHLQVFFYKVPKKNRDAIEKNLNKFRPWFQKQGVGLEYYSLSGRDSMEGVENIAKTLAATDDEDVWVEVQEYKNHKHAEETFAVMMKDNDIKSLGNELFGLISQGKSMVSGGFDRLRS